MAWALSIRPQYHLVTTTHDQQRRRDDFGQRRTGQVGPPAPGHHRPHPHTGVRGRDQGRARPGAGTEVADRQPGGVRLTGQPAIDVDQPSRQQLDVERRWRGCVPRPG